MHPGSTFTMEVRRGDTLTTLTPTAKAERIEVMGVGQTIGRIGITSAGMVERIPVSIPEAGSLAAVSIYDMTISTFVGISQIVTGIRPLSDIGGPVRIAELSGNAASLGWLAFFTLMAFISANLGLVNLLPIPVLDGGHLMFCLYEAITRRPISGRMVNVLSKVGASFLLLILVGLTFSDVLGLAGRIMN
jgi:regulator of sigma E protease